MIKKSFVGIMMLSIVLCCAGCAKGEIKDTVSPTATSVPVTENPGSESVEPPNTLVFDSFEKIAELKRMLDEEDTEVEAYLDSNNYSMNGLSSKRDIADFFSRVGGLMMFHMDASSGYEPVSILYYESYGYFVSSYSNGRDRIQFICYMDTSDGVYVPEEDAVCNLRIGEKNVGLYKVEEESSSYALIGRTETANSLINIMFYDDNEEVIRTTVEGNIVSVTLSDLMTPEGVAISEENFGDTRFCDYLKGKFDTDKNGYFSDAELAEVTEISAGMRNLLTPYSEMKGFTYFPELKRLELNSADKVEICDVPKLSEIELAGKNSEQNYRLGDLTIKNCPELETVWIQDVTAILRQEEELAEFVIDNCPKLQDMTLVGEFKNNFNKVSLKISGAPELSLHTYSCKPAETTLDTSISQFMELPVVDVKNKKVDTSGMEYITWNGETVTDYEVALTELEATVFRVRGGFFTEVQEVTPALYDEEGRKAYQVLINNKSLAGEYYGIRDVTLGYYSEYENDTFVMYSDEPLTEENFFFRWKNLLTMPVETYSPLRGVEGKFCGTKVGEDDESIRLGFAGDLYFRNGEEEEYFGEVKVTISYAITPEDGLQLWTTLDYEENPEGVRVAEGLWLTEASEAVTPAEEELPIAKDYFSNLIFRDYLEEWVDSDHNGYLSVEEREDVTGIYARDYDMGPNVVDGFEFFPNLSKICIGTCEKLVCKNCPELRLIAIFGDAPEDAVIRDGAAEVVTENCPKLEVIDTAMHPDVYWDNYLDW